jgi:hypothetical protein
VEFAKTVSMSRLFETHSSRVEGRKKGRRQRLFGGTFLNLGQTFFHSVAPQG